MKHQSTYKSLTDGDDVLTIGLNRAVDLIAQAPQRTPAKALGDHPDDGVPVTIHSGRYGPYVQHLKVRATLPKGVAEDSVTLAQAVELIAAKAAKVAVEAVHAAQAQDVAEQGRVVCSLGHYLLLLFLILSLKNVARPFSIFSVLVKIKAMLSDENISSLYFGMPRVSVSIMFMLSVKSVGF